MQRQQHTEKDGLSKFTGKVLKITQPSFFKSYFELKDGLDVLGILYYPKSMKIKAVAEIDDGKWEFKREKFWKDNLTIYESGKEIPLAKYYYHRHFRRNIVELPHGDRVIIEHKDWRYIYNVYNNNEKLVLRMKRRSLFKEKADINIYNGAQNLAEYPWIIMLVLHIALNRLHHIKPYA